MIRVMLVDDHLVVRRGLASIFSQERGFKIVASVPSAEDALAKLRHEADVDVVVLDVRLPGMDGIEAARAISSAYPKTGALILTNYPDEQAMLSAFSAGARGFVQKDSEESRLREAARSVASGGTFIDPSLGANLVALAIRGTEPTGPHGLTRKEMRILAFLPRGYTNKEIGESLGVSEQTVKTHVRAILRKLEAKDRAQAAAIAMKEGLT